MKTHWIQYTFPEGAMNDGSTPTVKALTVEGVKGLIVALRGWLLDGHASLYGHEGSVSVVSLLEKSGSGDCRSIQVGVGLRARAERHSQTGN